MTRERKFFKKLIIFFLPNNSWSSFLGDTTFNFNPIVEVSLNKIFQINSRWKYESHEMVKRKRKILEKAWKCFWVFFCRSENVNKILGSLDQTKKNSKLIRELISNFFKTLIFQTYKVKKKIAWSHSFVSDHFEVWKNPFL